MKKYVLFICAFLLLLAVEIGAVDFPEVPRVSAYEAYVKYKAGKAIIVQAGGEDPKKRRILGAFIVGQEAVFRGEMELPNFPKTGVEIFTFCY